MDIGHVNCDEAGHLENWRLVALFWLRLTSILYSILSIIMM